MSTGLKANSDGSAAIQVGGTDVITLTSSGAATFVTSPTTVQAGTAAAPAITTSGDTNTGIFFPAADTIAFAEGGVEAMRVDSSGNVGIGATSPRSRLDVTVTSGTFYQYLTNTSTGDAGVRMQSSTTADYGIFADSANVLRFYDFKAVAERARINSAGYSKFSDNGTYFGSTGSYHEFRQSASDWTAYNTATNSTGANCYGFRFSYPNASPNGTSNWFLYCDDSGGQRASIRSNGGLANYSANNTNLSDRREKTNFAPAKSYLDIICAIPVQTFNYIDQSEDDPGLTLGVVAQDVEAVAPELVMESNWGTEEEPKMRLSIYQTDLQYALMKCIQEQQALITQLQADVAALRGQA